MPAINKNDIVQSGLFIDEINNSKKLIQELDKLDDVFRSLSKNSKTLKEDLDLGKVEDLDKFLSLQKSVNSQFEDSIKISKERISIQKKLNDQTLKQKKTLEQLTADVASLRQQRNLLNRQEKQGLITAKEANSQRTKLNLEIKKSTTALNSAVKSVTTLTKAEKDLQIVQSKEAGTIERLNAKNRVLRRERERLNLDTREGANRLREINREIDKNNRALERNSDQLKKQRVGIGRYSKAIKSNIARFVGWTAVISLASRALRGASRLVIGFEKAQADLAGVLGKSRKQIKSLTDDAKRLGATTIFKPQEVSKLQKEFAKLGFGVGSIQNMTKATLDFAVATNTDLARSAEVVGNTLNGFQLGAEETTRVVNVMNESFSRSALDTERFSLAMGKVAPVANSANFSLEKTTATLGVLVSNGIRAETAGTGLRNILQIVAEKGLDLDEVLKKINGSTDRVASATALFGKQNASVAITMATMQDESAELTEQLEKQGRTAESVAEEQMDTLSGKLKELSSAWDGFLLSLESGDGIFSKISRSIIEFTTDVVNGLTNINTATKDLLQKELDDNIGKSVKDTQNNVKKLINEVSTGTVEDISEKIKEANKRLNEAIKSGFVLDQRNIKEELRLLNKGLDLRKESVTNEEIRLTLLKESQTFIRNSNILGNYEEQITKEKQLNSLTEKRNDLRDKLAKKIDETNSLIRKRNALSVVGSFVNEKKFEEIQTKINEISKERSKLSNELAVVDNNLRLAGLRLSTVVDDTNKELKKLSIERLKVLEQSTNSYIAELARRELERKQLEEIGTENEKQENGKKLSNYKRYLDEKLSLDQRYRDERLKLEREGIELDSDLAKQQNEIRLKEVEKLIEQEQALQLARINAGQQIEFEKLDELYKRREMLASESYRIEADIALKKNEEVFNDEFKKLEELRLKRIENLNNQGITSDTESGKAEIERVNAEIDELERKLDENREKRRDEIKIEREQKEKEQNEEFLDREREFNNEVVEAEKKKNEELLKAQEEADKKEEERNEKKKKAQKELYETLFGIAKAFSERWQQEIDKNIEKLDEEIKTSKDRVSELKNNSSQNRQTIDDNIAFEEKRQAQLEKQKLEQEKKKRQIELATTAVEVYSNKVANDDPNPLLNTIKDITLLQQFVKNLPLFYTGTNTTVGDALGSPTLNTQKDGYVVRVDKDEKILNPYLSAMTGNMTTKEIAQVSSDYQKGILSYSNPYDLMSQSSTVTNVMRDVTNSVLISQVNRQNEKIDETNKKLDALINKPVSSIFLDDTGAVPKIVQETIKGNIKENKNRYLR